jgi:hypothetical protein
VVRRGTVETAVAGTVLLVTDAAGGTRKENLPATGAIDLSLDPGKYEVSATVRTLTTAPQKVTIKAGASTEVVLVFET